MACKAFSRCFVLCGATLGTLACLVTTGSVRGWDQQYQSYKSLTCESQGVAALIASGKAGAISKTTCENGTPFFIGADCATCSVSQTVSRGQNPQTVPEGTGSYETHINCGLVLAGICGADPTTGLNKCLNMNYIYNTEGEGPVGCSAIPLAKTQVSNPK